MPFDLLNRISLLSKINRGLVETQPEALARLAELKIDINRTTDPVTGEDWSMLIPEGSNSDEEASAFVFGYYTQAMLVTCTMINLYRIRYGKNPLELLGYTEEIRPFPLEVQGKWVPLVVSVFVKNGSPLDGAGELSSGR